MWKKVQIACVLWALMISAALAIPLAVETVTEKQLLIPELLGLSDTENAQTIESISAPQTQGKFAPLPLGFSLKTIGPVWLKLSLAAPRPGYATRSFSPEQPLSVNLNIPIIADVFIRATSSSALAHDGWTQTTIEAKDIFTLPLLRGSTQVIYVRLAQTPSPWFHPTIQPLDSVKVPFLPLSLLVTGAFVLLAIASLLQGIKEKAVWRVWVTLFFGCILLQQQLTLPPLHQPFTYANLYILLMPGLALLIIPYIGRIILGTNHNAPFIDLFLKSYALVGLCVALVPLFPQYTWLCKLFPLWPLLLTPLFIVALWACITKRSGGMTFFWFCGFAIAGGIVTYININPLTTLPLGAEGSFWGLAIGGLALAFATPYTAHDDEKVLDLDFPLLHDVLYDENIAEDVQEKTTLFAQKQWSSAPVEKPLLEIPLPDHTNAYVPEEIKETSDDAYFSRTKEQLSFTNTPHAFSDTSPNDAPSMKTQAPSSAQKFLTETTLDLTPKSPFVEVKAEIEAQGEEAEEKETKEEETAFTYTQNTDAQHLATSATTPANTLALAKNYVVEDVADDMTSSATNSTDNQKTEQTPSISHASGAEQTPSISHASGAEQTPSISHASGAEQTPSISHASGAVEAIASFEGLKVYSQKDALPLIEDKTQTPTNVSHSPADWLATMSDFSSAETSVDTSTLVTTKNLHHHTAPAENLQKVDSSDSFGHPPATSPQGEGFLPKDVTPTEIDVVDLQATTITAQAVTADLPPASNTQAITDEETNTFGLTHFTLDSFATEITPEQTYSESAFADTPVTENAPTAEDATTPENTTAAESALTMAEDATTPENTTAAERIIALEQEPTQNIQTLADRIEDVLIEPQFFKENATPLDDFLQTPTSTLSQKPQFVDSLEKPFLPNENEEEAAQTIQASPPHMQNVAQGIAQDIENERKENALPQEIFTLHVFIENTVQNIATQAKQKGITFSWVIDPRVAHVLQGDATGLERVLYALLKDVIDLTQAGFIQLTVREFALIKENTVQLAFIIIDTGTADRRCASWSEAETFAQNTHGKFDTNFDDINGFQTLLVSTFDIADNALQKPHASPLQKPIAKVSTNETKMPRGEYIVITDMTTTNSRLISYYLSSCKYAHEEARNLKLLPEIFEKENIGLIIVDLDMPDDEVREIIALAHNSAKGHKQPHPAILALISHKGQMERAKKFECNHTLLKPFSQEDFIDTVRLCVPTLQHFETTPPKIYPAEKDTQSLISRSTEEYVTNLLSGKLQDPKSMYTVKTTTHPVEHFMDTSPERTIPNEATPEEADYLASLGFSLAKKASDATLNKNSTASIADESRMMNLISDTISQIVSEAEPPSRFTDTFTPSLPTLAPTHIPTLAPVVMPQEKSVEASNLSSTQGLVHEKIVIPDLDGESIFSASLPQAPKLLRALKDSLALCDKGIAEHDLPAIEKGAGLITDIAKELGLDKLEKIAGCVERAAHAQDSEAAFTLHEDLHRVLLLHLERISMYYQTII